MSTLTEIKKGQVIKYNNAPHLIVAAQFLRMQQRKPVVRTKMKNVKTGQTVEYSFKQGEKIEYADIGRQKATYLYREGENLWFMDSENYDQVAVNKNIVGEAAKFLKESQAVDLTIFEESIIGVELPPKVVLKVASAPEGVKGDTATNAFKPATLETGVVINVPLFINEGDSIRVNTESGEYVERA